MSSGPLDGITIIDVTQAVAGPMATGILADQGANVIKVEPPGSGDLARSLGAQRSGMAATFAAINRNKRSIVLDLREGRGQQAIKALVAKADAFVQNFRPGVAERLGVDEPTLRAVRKDLVYASINGFGETGPYARERAYDPIIQALSGLAELHADPDSGRPRMVRLIIADKVTALTAAQAITAALLKRQRTGEGQHLRLAMLDAVVAFMWPEAMSAFTFVEPDESPKQAPKPPRRDLVFQTKAGFITVGAATDREWSALAHAVGRPEWLHDPRFDTPAKRMINADERFAVTEEALKARTAAEWLPLLRAADVPCAPVLSRAEMLENEQVVSNNLVVEADYPGLGRLRMARPAARFDRAAAPTLRPPPKLGQHTEEVLREFGLDPDEFVASRRETTDDTG